MSINFNNHELVHDAPEASDIESKFIEGAFTYNEYALHYQQANDIERFTVIIQNYSRKLSSQSKK